VYRGGDVSREDHVSDPVLAPSDLIAEPCGKTFGEKLVKMVPGEPNPGKRQSEAPRRWKITACGECDPKWERGEAFNQLELNRPNWAPECK